LVLLCRIRTREKVTFLASTTRKKVTSHPEKGDLRCVNSRKKVTMHLEKGDLFQTTSGFEITRKKVTLFPRFQRFSEGNPIFTVPTIYPEKGDLCIRFQKEQVPKKE
jgi:hypothetical protein